MLCRSACAVPAPDLRSTRYEPLACRPSQLQGIQSRGCYDGQCRTVLSVYNRMCHLRYGSPPCCRRSGVAAQ